MLRFAPSPTGDMHIGNLRVAVYNFLMAKKLNKKLILRIEDTDIQRNIQDKDKEILALMKEFNISFDEVIYQSDNFNTHRDLALSLIKSDKAFYCYCSKEFLDEKRKEAQDKKIAFRYKDEWANLEKGDKTSSNIIRLRVNDGVKFNDLIKGDIYFSKDNLDSFIIMRDGVPLYNFACAIDDKDMSLIIRGEDHVSNTPKQILIKRAVGFNEACEYAHLPIILNSENVKMSKRDNHSSVKYLLSLGLDHESIRNYLIILGNAKLEKTIDDGEDFESIVDRFDIHSISKNPAKFDYKRLLNINKNLLRKLGVSQDLLHSLRDCFNGLNPNDFKNLVDIYLHECNTITSLQQDLSKIFLSLDEKENISKEFSSEFNILKNILLDKNNDLLNLSYKDFKDRLMDLSKLKGRHFFKPLRILLSGKDDGIEIEILYNAISKHLDKILNKGK